MATTHERSAEEPMAMINVRLRIDDAATLAHGVAALLRAPLLMPGDRDTLHRVYDSLAWAGVASWEVDGISRRSPPPEPE